jgi:hypothetical protein
LQISLLIVVTGFRQYRDFGTLIAQAVAHFIDEIVESYRDGTLLVVCLGKRTVVTLTVIEVCPLRRSATNVCSLRINQEGNYALVLELELICDTHANDSFF